MNIIDGRKETPEEMLRAMQEIFCTGRYKPFALLQEEIRKNKKREEKQTKERGYSKRRKNDG